MAKGGGWRMVVACAVLMAWVSAEGAGAEVKPAPIFSDHMVLQTGKSVPVWGTAEPGEKVTVEFAGQKKTGVADKDGRWRVQLDAMPVNSEGGLLRVLAGDAAEAVATVKDVLVGEVWLCSGQSNMAMGVDRCRDAEAEAAAADYPLIRQSAHGGRWRVCSSNTVSGFSGTAYFFGRHLHQELGVPVGLMNLSRGGTPVEHWTPEEDLMQLPYARQQQAKYRAPEAVAAFKAAAPLQAEFQEQHKVWREARKAGDKDATPPVQPEVEGFTRKEEIEYGIYRRSGPGNLYRRYIAPVVGYAIRGVIWYQGERNAHSVGGAQAYRDLLPLMIKSWRERWNDGNLPFIYVQLPNYRSRIWPLMRESMLKTLSVPNTAMAVTIDVGEVGNIHPRNKQDVGLRLALAARHLAYGQELVWSGPLYESMKVDGGKTTLVFNHTGTGLMAKDVDELTGFMVAGADKKWEPAEAVIQGETVIVSSSKVPEPVAVRYAWAGDPTCNLYNREGLPASPFRTDDWDPAP